MLLVLNLWLFTASLCAIPIEVVKHLGGADTGQYPLGALTRGEDGFFYGTARNGGRYGYGTVYRISADGVMTTLFDFDDNTTGRYPQGPLTARADGSLYGTTQYGGAGGQGTVFKISRSGLVTTVVSFSGPNGDEPAGGLLLASDGCLYGVTDQGGPQNYGTVFRVHPDDSFSTVAVFSYNNGAQPVGSLVEVAAGEFLGVFRTGTNLLGGGVFKVTSSGNLGVFKAFSNGINRPEAGLIRASDGNFYGTSAGGGTNNIGAVYRLTPTGETAVIASFTGSNSATPRCELIQGADGDLYGTTTGIAGSSIPGSVFRVSLQGTLTTLARFSPPLAPYWDNYPVPGLCRDSDGSMLGVTPFGGSDGKGTVFRITNAGVLQTLAFFQGDGPANPEGSLTAGADGILYGATPKGGIYQQGTLFSVTPSGRVKVLLNGAGLYAFPRERPLFSSDGFLYSTIDRGGAYGAGSLFRLPHAGGTPATLFSFSFGAPHETFGAQPKGELIEGADGMLYGAATSGGISASQGGTIFKMSKSGAIERLKAFAGPEGSHAGPGLLRSADGSLYGVTRFSGPSGNGTVFKIAPDGGHSILAAFGGQNGSYPRGELIWGAGKQLLGVTSNGGSHDFGTIFSVNETGGLTTLHSFRGSDGSYPYGGLVMASDGNYYGTTYSGGAGGWGTVYRLTAANEFSTIASFTGPEGKYLYGSLVENSDGDLYGMTRTGGALDAGTIFRLTVKPPEMEPPSFPGGVAGSVVTLQGRHLGAVTSVTIGGVPVAFKVVSPREIVVTVPPNAVSGSLRVDAPLGTVETDKPFYSVSTLSGDDDGDGLPNSWEIEHGLNPHDNGAVDPANGATGDGDHDSIPNLIEWALEGMGMQPGKPDSERLARPEIIGEQLTWEYRRDSRKSVTLSMEVSVDLEHWFSAGEAGAPTGFKDELIDQAPPWEIRRATLPVTSGERVFLRLKAVQ